MRPLSAWSLLLPLLFAAPVAQAGWEPKQKAWEEYRLAVSDIQGGEMEAGLTRLDRADALDPKCGACALARAEALLKLNRVEEGLAVVRELERRHRDRPEVHAVKALLAFGAEDFARAERAARTAIELRPGWAPGWDVLLMVAIRLGDGAVIDECLDALRPLLSSSEFACVGADALVHKGDLDAAESLITSCNDAGSVRVVRANIRIERGEGRGIEAELSDDADAVDPHEAAVSAYNRQAYAEALELGRSALAERPDDPALLLIMGRSLHQLGRDDEALETLESVLGRQPTVDITRKGFFVGIVTKRSEERYLAEVASGVTLYVELLAERGEVERLKDGLDTLARRWPEVGAVDGAQALLATAQGDARRGWSLLDRALKEHPDDTSLGAFAAWMVGNDPDHASELALARLRHPSSAVSAFNAAVRLTNAGRHDLCLEILAGEPGPRFDARRWARLRYQCAEAAGDVAAADAAMAAVGGEDGLTTAQRYNRALDRYRAGAYAEALDALDALDEVRDEALSAQVEVLRGSCLIGLGDVERALQFAAGPHADDPFRYNLAVMLRDARRVREALAHVPRGEVEPPELAASADLLLVELLLAQGDLSGARAVLGQGRAGPEATVMVASKMLVEDEVAAAAPLLEQACPRVTHPEMATYCADTLPKVRDHLDR